MRDPPGPPLTALDTRERDNQLCPSGNRLRRKALGTPSGSSSLVAGPNSASAGRFSACPALTEAALSLPEGRRQRRRVVDGHKSCLRCQR